MTRRRSPSPAPSDNEVDIGNALFDDSDASGNETTARPAPDLLDFNDLLNNGDGQSDDGDGDEEFIAARLRGANRKSSNLHGKTVKKGGGFQAMGRPPNHTLQILEKRLLTCLLRPQFEPPQGYNQERLLCSHAHPAQDNSPDFGKTRCCWNGSNWFRKDGCIRYSHDRATQSSQCQSRGEGCHHVSLP